MLRSPRSIALTVGCFVVAVMLSGAHANLLEYQRQATDSDPNVAFHVVESIPVGMSLSANMSIYDAWMDMISSAKTSLDITCFYMTLTDGTAAQDGLQGQNVYKAIMAAAGRGVAVRVVSNTPSSEFPQKDLLALQAQHLADVRFLDFEKALGNSGILHTKAIVADNSSAYLGSANLDWRSLTQVKELGVYVTGSTQLAPLIGKNFEVNWLVALDNVVPTSWPSWLTTTYNMSNPLAVQLNGSWSTVLVSSAPPQLTPPGWTADVDDIVGHMADAEEFIYIEMMDYVPAIVYATPSTYWPYIDDAIRAAAYRNVSVRLLIGYWAHSSPQQKFFLDSLNVLPNVDVKYFQVPPVSPPIPFSRVAHDKWFVTDKAAFVGTSNWCGDYFTTTGGLGFASPDQRFIDVAVALHDRDWTSQYSSDFPSPSG